MFYQKNNSGGHGSNVYTGDRFFQEEVLLLRKEQNNEQKTIVNLLNINYIHRTSDEPGKEFYKNTNAQLFQPVENNTYKDITLNQTQSEVHRNEEIQPHPDM